MKILDFGIGEITGRFVGTRYMAPEQARGTVDSRSDVFAAGAVF